MLVKHGTIIQGITSGILKWSRQMNLNNSYSFIEIGTT